MLFGHYYSEILEGRTRYLNKFSPKTVSEILTSGYCARRAGIARRRQARRSPKIC
jgi:hypothetical protein